MHFSVSGVDVPIWLPPLVSFIISFFTSMVGVSGAFILLPFQVSVLGFTTPAVSPTNLVYNIVAIPGGVYRYFRDGRMLFPLALIIIAGTLPGIIAGGFIRLEYLPDPKLFKVFAGFVLFYICIRLFIEMIKNKDQKKIVSQNSSEKELQWNARTINFSLNQYKFEFQDEVYNCKTVGIFILSLIVGLVGGIYGIGGGAIIAPFLVAIYRLPVYAIAGATLVGTFVTSIFGVLFYQVVAPLYETSAMTVSPDWALGALFGLGGLFGIYLGAKVQRFVRIKWLKLLLGLMLLFVALSYILGYFF
ncbi:MAG: sulfite exporter TauE/SafE family protein [Ignavibacteriaceae bacterium]